MTGFFNSHTNQLETFSPLVQWLKKMDILKYSELCKSYSKSFKTITKKVAREFFSETKKYLVKDSKDRKYLNLSPFIRSKESSSSSSSSKPPEKMIPERVFYIYIYIYIIIMIGCCILSFCCSSSYL